MTPLRTSDLTQGLANYPHVAGCPTCAEYVDAYVAECLEDYASGRMVEDPGLLLLAAVLAHHDTGHTIDPLFTASEHF